MTGYTTGDADAALEGSAPGMAAERTDLAWSRSGVSLGACGVIVLKGLPGITGNARDAVAGAVLLALGALTWGLGYWSSHRRRPQPGRPRPVARWTDLAPTAYGTAAVGMAGLLLAILGG